MAQFLEKSRVTISKPNNELGKQVFSYENQEGRIKDYLTHLGFSIIRHRDTSSRRSLGNVCCMCESCFSLSSDIPGPMNRWQKGWAIGCWLKRWMNITNLIFLLPVSSGKMRCLMANNAVLEFWVHLLLNQGKRWKGPSWPPAFGTFPLKVCLKTSREVLLLQKRMHSLISVQKSQKFQK